MSHTNTVPNYNMTQSCSAVGTLLILLLPLYFSYNTSMFCLSQVHLRTTFIKLESIWDLQTITSYLWSNLTKQSFSLCFQLSSNLSGATSGYLLRKLLSRTRDERPNTEVIDGYTIHFQLGALCFHSLPQMVWTAPSGPKSFFKNGAIYNVEWRGR